MLDGTLPWRKATADRGATQRLKDECVANPEQLCSQVVMPGTPSADRLAQCVMPLIVSHHMLLIAMYSQMVMLSI